MHYKFPIDLCFMFIISLPGRRQLIANKTCQFRSAENVGTVVVSIVMRTGDPCQLIAFASGVAAIFNLIFWISSFS